MAPSGGVQEDIPNRLLLSLPQTSLKELRPVLEIDLWGEAVTLTAKLGDARHRGRSPHKLRMFTLGRHLISIK